MSIYLPTSTAVTSNTTNAQITRGRTSALFDAIDPATGTVLLNNEDRKYDPLYSSSPFFGEVVPGRQITVVSGGVTIYDARVSNWDFEYDVSGKSNAVVSTEDALAKLGRARFDEWTTTFGDTPAERITAVLARPEVNYTGTTALDDGVFVLADDLITWGSNVLNYCQLVAQSDQGLFFVDRTGVLTFKDRHAFIGAASAATFGTGGIGFSGITTSYGTDLLYNRVQVERSDPVLADAPEPEPVTATDATSIAAYEGTFTLSLPGLLLQDDTQAQDLASQLLDIYKDPIYRFEAITVDVHGLSSGNQTTVLGLDIGSVVTVTWTPNRVGTATTRTCIVEGVSHSVMPGTHVMTFTLNDSSIAQTGNYWAPGVATYGVFDVGGTDATNYPIAF